MLANIIEIVAVVGGVAAIVWGAETFAEHLTGAARRLRVTTFALALLLAGAEPEELATSVTATLRHAPAIAFGDVIGANVAICLVALGVGAVVGGVPFGTRILRYAVLGVPVVGMAVLCSWDGTVGRGEGLALVGSYVAFVGVIWVAERRPPALGETAGLADEGDARSRPAADVVLVLAGLGAMILGASVLVEGARRLVHAEAGQVKLSLTVIGFATAFELVVLAWSAARRGMSEAVVAGVVGSVAYNATMTLGAAALVRPLHISRAAALHAPAAAMAASLLLVISLALPGRGLGRGKGLVLLCLYPLFWLVALR